MSSFVITIVLSLAAVLHGLTGMGFPLIATPALAMSFSLPQAIALLALPTLLLNALVVFAKPHKPHSTSHQNAQIADNFATLAHRYWRLVLASVIGGIIGVQLLFILPLAYLNVMMAVVILFYAVQGLLSVQGVIRPINVPTGNVSMTTFGLLSGLVGGATNAMSPILLMYLLSKSDDKSEIAKASNLCYLLAKLIQIILLWQEFVRFDDKMWALTATITAFCCFGLFIGAKLRHRISQLFFKRLIYGILLVIGVKVGVAGMGALL